MAAGFCCLEQESHPYHAGMISVIPPNYPHNTVSREQTESYWEYLFVDVEKILQAMYPDDLLFQQKMLEKVNQKAYLGRESDAAELAALVHTILEEIRQKRDVLYKESVCAAFRLALLIQIVRINSGSALLSEGGASAEKRRI